MRIKLHVDIDVFQHHYSSCKLVQYLTSISRKPLQNYPVKYQLALLQDVAVQFLVLERCEGGIGGLDKRASSLISDTDIERGDTSVKDASKDLDSLVKRRMV